MSTSATAHRFDVPADYVEGDPAEPQPLTGGTLTLAPGGILFDCDGSGFAAELDELEGITVTGSRVRRPGFEASTRGYTKVALIRNGRPIIWEFSIDRSAGTELRDMLSRVFEASGRQPLPYVEELNGFGDRASTQATGEMAALTPEAVRREAARQRKSATRPKRSNGRPRVAGRSSGRPRVADRSNGRLRRSNGRPRPTGRSNGRARSPVRSSSVKRSRKGGRQRLTVKQRRLIFAAVGAMVFLEIAVPLLILRVL